MSRSEKNVPKCVQTPSKMGANIKASVPARKGEIFRFLDQIEDRLEKMEIQLRRIEKEILAAENRSFRQVGSFAGLTAAQRAAEEELRRAFFSARFVRVLDALGYTRFRHWRIFGEEALAGKEAALWLAAESLTVEHAGEPLSRYRVRLEADTGELRSVEKPRLFETSHGRCRPQRRLFALDALGEGGWLKVMRLQGYAPRAPRRARHLQQTLFPYAEAL